MLRFSGVALLLVVGGCAGVEELTGQTPIVDRKGVSQGQFAADLADCQLYADQVQSGRQVVTGAAGGAVVGGAVGAVVGNHKSVARAAGVGAVAGGARGAAGAMAERRLVLRNCLENRGYRVLN
jgi:outer membrane lipoprotein SlyB